MANTASQDPYGTPAWRARPGFIDEVLGRLWYGGKGLWIAITILAFIAWWPLGIAALVFLIWRGRMGCGGYRRRREWAERHGNGGPGWAGPWGGWRSFCGEDRGPPSSGNRAFDEYRTETLRRLEEEQREFASFLDRLRFARDKAEFDQFMNERRQPPQPPAEPT